MLDQVSLAREIGVDTLQALPRDVSPRQYYRGEKDGRNFIVMLYPEVNAQNHAEMMGFIRIGAWLSAQGIKTPDLYDVNEDLCFAVFEDLGATSFGTCFHQGVLDKPALYKLGTDVLIRMKNAGTPDLDLPKYNQSRIHENRRQLLDYYMAYIKGTHIEDRKVDEFYDVWDQIEQSLPMSPVGFVHGDYHLENLMYMDQAQGVEQCALIDYQDALLGPIAYDLVNLLEDARIDIPDDIRRAMIDHYCEGMGSDEKQTFTSWYRVLSAQFHGRVLGLFIKLAAEQSRDGYLIHIPRLQNYMLRSLEDPILAPLKAWFEKEGVDFQRINDLDGNHIRSVFQNISFS